MTSYLGMIVREVVGMQRRLEMDCEILVAPEEIRARL